MGSPRIDAIERAGSALRCALCHGGLDLDGAWTCPACGTATHRECLEAAPRCPTLGCVQERPQATAPTTVRRPWGVKAVLQGSAAGLGSFALGLAYGSYLTNCRFGLQESAAFVAVYALCGGVAGHTAAAFDAWRARRGLVRPPVKGTVLAILYVAGAGLVASLLAAAHQAAQFHLF